MTEQEINRLARKLMEGTITPEEKERFLAWYNAFNEPELNIEIGEEGSEEDAEKRIWQQVGGKTFGRKSTVRSIGLGWIKYAAAIIILFGIGAYLWNAQQKEKPLITESKPVPVKNDIAPGSDRAVLTLSNGQQVELGNAGSETIRDGTLSIENINGQLVYGGNPPPTGGTRFSKGGEAASLTYNSMQTPKGGQYHLVLADGTNVWLNAASSITYPTSFTGPTREVKITGEAYLEVSKDKTKPFIVSTGKQRIEVLGTTFNVNAYTDEAVTKTTLIEGAVRVKAGAEQTVLQPGQQALAGNNLTKNSNADIAQAVSWKNGAFNFNRQDFESCMRQLARWYDVEVVYDQGVPKEVFGGKMDRNLTLMQVLRGLEGVVARFRLEGKVLHVLPK